MHGKLALAAAIVAVVCGLAVPRARADEWNQAVKFHFSQPVEVPGHILPAGSYWFKLANNHGSRNIVEIFNHNYSRLEATLVTASQRRQQVTGRTEITFAERPHDLPEAVLGWYYPGSLTGHAFIYPQHQETRLRADAKQNLLVSPNGTVPPETSAATQG